ncbi:MAG: amino acid permease, partial [Proteobacteria bacterium]|nr:amino acid permease [Pseudomonadota bacterium]
MNTSVPTPSHSERPPHLRRALGLWRLVLYGLGVIIGAGIYVLIGTVVATAGMAAPLSFLAAGILAALVGLCYAELGARFPEAAGAAAYVKHGFGSDRLSQLTGLAVAAVAVVGAASIAHGCIGYAQRLVDLPGTSIAGGIVLCFTAVACLRVGESVGAAAVLAALEVAGLLVLIVLGTPALSALPARVDELIPADWSAWHGVAAGAFLAFFAFIGFE